VTDRPRLVGWSSLHHARHRSLTPLVVIAGTPRRFQNRREAGSTCTLRCPPCVDPGDLDRHHAAPCGANMSNDRDAFRRVAIDRVTPVADAASAFCLECAARPRAPFSRRSHRLVRQHWCGNLLGQRRAPDSPCGSSRRHDARCVEPTSAFSRFRTSTRASLVPVASQRLRAPRDRGDRLSHVSAIRFGGPHVLCVSSRWAFLFPSRCVRTEPLASLSPLSRVRTRSRGVHTDESRRDRPQLARVNDASW
jgi:hypothetical protein